MSRQTLPEPELGGTIVSPPDIGDLMQQYLWQGQAHKHHSPMLGTLGKVISNILNNPSSEKYKVVNLSKSKVNISAVPGAISFLLACGFKLSQNEYKDW